MSVVTSERYESLTNRELEILSQIASGASNRQIAEALYLTEGTIKWHNKNIFAKLGVDNRTQAIIRGRDLNLLDQTDRLSADNLPTTSTTFIGRETEIQRLSALLDDPACRCLSLVGQGGIGKTRLALALAHHKRGDYEDGVWFIALQPLQSLNDILAALLDTFQLQPNPDSHNQIMGYLSGKNMLLILDNFEHLLDYTPFVSNLLDSASGIKVLNTSRERLHLREEWVRQISGLDFPQDQQASSTDASDAVQLFADRAQRVHDDFSLTAELDNVIRICQTVEGMPLAIELAVTWLSILPCAALANRIQNNLDLLAAKIRDVPDRHKSVRAAFDTSWSLLTIEERGVFTKLAVFRDGFTLQAAESVAGATLISLSSLVDKSLVHMHTAGRFDMHELLRQYAMLQLEATDQAKSTRQAHCEFYISFLHQREQDIKGRRQLEAWQEIASDFENIRAAWSLAVNLRDNAAIERGAECLYMYAALQCSIPIYNELFPQAAERLAPQGQEAPSPTWSRVMVRSTFHDRSKSWLPMLNQALRLARQSKDVKEIGRSQSALAHLYVNLKRFTEALVFYNQCLNVYQHIGDPYHIADTLRGISQCHYSLGNIHIAETSNQQSLELCQNARDILGEYWCRNIQSQLWLLSGDYAGASQALLEGFTLMQTYVPPDKFGVLMARILRWHHVSHGLIVLLQGDIAAAQAHRQALIKLGIDLTQDIGRPPMFAGILATLTDDYMTGKHLLEQVEQVYLPWLDVVFIKWGLSLACMGLNLYEDAQRYLSDLLQDAIAAASDALLTLALPIAAVLINHEERPEDAAALLGLAFTHPNSATGWMTKWSLLTQLRANLKCDLDPETYAAAWQYGLDSNLNATVEALLSDFQNR